MSKLVDVYNWVTKQWRNSVNVRILILEVGFRRKIVRSKKKKLFKHVMPIHIKFKDPLYGFHT